ncbi:hypothetical protein HYT92_03550 [Candidatus Pacearchaeota archaeon]|nr:hypothetical protein [Candidatus Pacearchaeota archaeon]
MTEEETELTSKQKLERYEYGGLAGRIFKDQSRSAYSLEAMRGLYAGFGLDEDDPVLARSFAEAYAGARDGQVTNSGIFKAIELYSKKYEIAYGESKVGDFMEYVEGKGFSDIPDEVKSIIDKYKDRTIEELEDEAKDAKRAGDREKYEEYSKVVSALGLLKNYVLEGVLYANLVKESTRRNLEGILEERRR